MLPLISIGLIALFSWSNGNLAKDKGRSKTTFIIISVLAALLGPLVFLLIAGNLDLNPADPVSKNAAIYGSATGFLAIALVYIYLKIAKKNTVPK